MEQNAEQQSSGTERHRMSTEGHESQLIDAVRGTLDRLNVLWDRVSMEDSKREARTQRVFDHMHGLLDDIVTAEEGMVQGVGANIEAHRHAVDRYRRELSMTSFDETLYQPGSIALLKELKKEHERLVAKRNEALKYQGDVHDRLITLHSRLGSYAPRFEDVDEVILPAAKRGELERACEQAEHLLNDRLEVVQMVHTNIKRRIERLGVSDLTEEEFGLQALDFTADGVVVSVNTLQRLEALQDKLELAWSDWQADAQFQFVELRCRLEHLYDACFVPDDERLLLDDFDTETHGTERLHMLKETADTLEQRHERAGEVFSKFKEWHTLWQEKTVAEEGSIDYKGRDYMRRIKRTTELETLIPRALQDLCGAVMDYFRDHPDKGEADLLIGGQRADRHAQFLQEQYAKEKEEKRQAKKNLPTGRKFSHPTNGDRHLHQIRRTPMKPPRKPTSGNFNINAVETVLSHNKANASFSRSSIDFTLLTATSTPIQHRKFGARLSTKSATPSTSQRGSEK
ncbi:CRE-SPD-1 protein [Aphelenchoides avenae]|nr:CRE-SPD-1 protein [Aphelenchus avenae]